MHILCEELTFVDWRVDWKLSIRVTIELEHFVGEVDFLDFPKQLDFRFMLVHELMLSEISDFVRDADRFRREFTSKKLWIDKLLE